MIWAISLYPRFSFPGALFLLALVPAFVYFGYRIGSLPPGRKWVSIVLRSLIVALLVLALAGAEIVRRHDRLAVFFLLDHSNSIPEDTRLAAAETVRAQAAEFMTDKDEAGVIVFGDEPSLELGVGPTLGLDQVRSFVGGEQTDIASAIRLAMAAFPQGYMRRIVIITDGNETRGHALEEAKIAQAGGVEIDTLPLAIGGDNEVRVSEVSAPGQTDADEPFQLRVVVKADQDCEGTLRVYQRLKEGKRLIVVQDVTLREGDNVFLLSQELHNSGFYEYEVTIESEADTVLANNEGIAYTVVSGEPRLLYVEADPNSTFLKPALEREGLRVDMTDPAGMPFSLAGLQNYDAIILSGVSSVDLGIEQMRNIQAAVRDLGIGLVMIGGPDSYGAGGFIDTPVEEALPVDMDIKQRKVMPRGALVLVLHTCEIPDGNAWAREIGLASLNVLASQDLMGAVGYMWGGGGTGDTWIYNLQPVGDKQLMRRLLTNNASRIGDMPAVQPSLQLAYKALAGADAAVKRVVIISDGDPAAPTQSLIDDLVEAEISVSTVCIAPHSPNDQNMLKWIAGSTGGMYYYVTNANNLPQIFSKEAAVVKRGVLIEEAFTPIPKHDSELLIGILGEGIPGLRGYVATTPKPNATIPLVSHEDDPILAHWRYGLGKSVAFTSDVTTRWAPAWVGWEGFNRFWAQTARWAMREMSDSNFRVDVKAEGGKGRIRIDAVDEEGKFVNFLRPRAVVTGPGPEFKRHELDLLQTGPGIYEAEFPLDKRGGYMVNLTYADPGGKLGMIPAGLALSYSREYEYNTTNLPLLENVAAVTGGSVFDSQSNPFEHNLKASASVTPIWHILAIIAACLFPAEIFVRRVAINYARYFAPLVNLARKIPGLGSRLPAFDEGAVPATGSYGASAAPPAPAPPPGVVAEEAAAPAAPASPPRAKSGSFGQVVKPTAEEIKEAKEKKKAGKKDAQAAEYTSKLLEAKKRAREKQKRGSGEDPDKEG